MNPPEPRPPDFRIELRVEPCLIPLEKWPVVRIMTPPEPFNSFELAALGEALLRYVRDPIIALVPFVRPPTLSIGFFQSASEVPAGTPFVRRQTSGGLVDAANSFSVITFAPFEHPRAWMSPEQTTTTFNQAVAEALNDVGCPVYPDHKAPPFAPQPDKPFGPCFADIFRYDLVDGPRKVAASGFHKCQTGIHQEIGIRSDGLDWSKLAPALERRLLPLYGNRAVTSEPTEIEKVLAAEFMTKRYATREWNFAR